MRFNPVFHLVEIVRAPLMGLPVEMFTYQYLALATGYRNLLKIVSRAHLDGFYYKPRADRALIEAHDVRAAFVGGAAIAAAAAVSLASGAGRLVLT